MLMPLSASWSWPRSSISLAILALIVFHYPQWLDRLLITPFPSPAPQDSAVLITGTSSGLGRNAAFSLADNGYTIIGTVRTAEDADRLKGEWRKERALPGGEIIPIIMDVAEDQSVLAGARAVAAILEERNLSLAAVVNNAGVGGQGPVLSRAGTASSYSRTFNVNVFGVVRVTQAFLPLMNLSGGGGRLVNVGSVAGVMCQEGGAPYTATKHALEGMSDAWRRELSKDKVSVSLIHPGFIASKMCDAPICDEKALPEFSNAVLHAVRDPYPKTRYAVAGKVGRRI